MQIKIKYGKKKNEIIKIKSPWAVTTTNDKQTNPWKGPLLVSSSDNSCFKEINKILNLISI